MARLTRKESDRQQANNRTAFIKQFSKFDATEAQQEIVQAHIEARKNGETQYDDKTRVPYTSVTHDASVEMKANFAQLLQKCRQVAEHRPGMVMYKTPEVK